MLHLRCRTLAAVLLHWTLLLITVSFCYRQGRSLGYSKTEKKIGAGERFPPQINF